MRNPIINEGHLPPAGPASRPLGPFRHRNYRLFFIGQLISVTGTWMQSTAQEWLVYRLTGSQLSLGVVTFASYIPVLAFSLFMGVLVDRYSRRKILIFTQSWYLLMAVILTLLTAFQVVAYWHLLVLSVMLGLANALDMPARQSLYMDMVDRQDLQNAIVLNSTLFNIARIIGPAVAGVVVAVVGEAPAFAINALSYLAMICGLLLMRMPVRPPGETFDSNMISLRKGLRYIVEDRRVFSLVLAIAAYSFFVFPFLVLLPALATDIFKLGADGYGLMLSARGFGALGGALGILFLPSRRTPGSKLQQGRILLTLSALALGLAPSFHLAIIALVFAGYALILQMTLTNTLIQTIVPEQLRGRVVSSYTWALGGFWPLGSLMIGALGDHFGTQTAILISGIACVVVTIFFMLVFPETSRLGVPDAAGD